MTDRPGDDIILQAICKRTGLTLQELMAGRSVRAVSARKGAVAEMRIKKVSYPALVAMFATKLSRIRIDPQEPPDRSLEYYRAMQAVRATFSTDPRGLITYDIVRGMPVVRGPAEVMEVLVRQGLAGPGCNKHDFGGHY